MSRDNVIWLFASMTSHFILLAALVIIFPASSHVIPFSHFNQQLISSHLVDANNIAAATTSPRQHKSIRLLKNTIAIASQPPIAASSRTPEQHTRNKGQPMPALLAALHAAIQRQQQYPASAEEMGREGRVTLSFKLFTDGSIDHLQVLHTSGTSSLDYAALTAVNAATPFQHVAQYLTTAEDYQIDVVFKLS
jgi:TonB family protein